MSSAAPFPFCFQSFLASESFLMSQLFTSSGHKYLSFSINISPSSEYSGLISFRIFWFVLLVAQGTLKNLLQHHSLKTSILQQSALLMVQLSHLYTATGKTIALTRQTFVSKVMSLVVNMLSRWRMGKMSLKTSTVFRVHMGGRGTLAPSEQWHQAQCPH